MRPISVLAITAAALALAAFEAPRATGAYASAPTPNAEACAQLCAEDTLCMAWTYAQNSCALRATIPANMSMTAGGVSPRAPQSLRPTPAAVVTPPTPPPAAASPTPRPETVETAMLLGGPEEESRGLRPGFGGSR